MDRHDLIVAAMQRADELSLRGLGRTSPNPIVGAVLIDDQGIVISEGFHQRGSTEIPGKHAEIVALDGAGERARGATLIVTLEPCNHQGKTPPCTEAIIASGVARVVMSIPDPNPVASGGVARLREAGIAVESGVLASQVAFTNRAWLHKITQNRTFVTAKVAATLDGYVAAADGSSQWITSQASRSDVSRLRSGCDAIITGTGTVLFDDPRLTVRGIDDSQSDFKQPVRIILGKREIPQTARIRSEEGSTYFLQTHEIRELLDLTSRLDLNRVLLEAGSTLVTAFIKAGLVDELFLYQAPTLLGSGRSMVGELGISTLSQRLDFQVTEVAMIGDGEERNIRTHFLSQSTENLLRDFSFQSQRSEMKVY